MRIPNPLEIVEHYGDSSAAVICEEILALTKVNWNSCFFGSSVPITIRFAKNVGKILAELPPGVTPQTKYKFICECFAAKCLQPSSVAAQIARYRS